MIQPYMKAYMKINKDIKAHEYINWITRKHAEFKRMKGIAKYQPYTESQEKEFIEFINKEG